MRAGRVPSRVLLASVGLSLPQRCLQQQVGEPEQDAFLSPGSLCAAMVASITLTASALASCAILVGPVPLLHLTFSLLQLGPQESQLQKALGRCRDGAEKHLAGGQVPSDVDEPFRDPHAHKQALWKPRGSGFMEQVG